MPPKAKSILMWIVVIFLIYAVATNPDGASSFVEGIIDFVSNLITGFVRFFDNLAS